jgi:AraC-like DNA-binding protein
MKLAAAAQPLPDWQMMKPDPRLWPHVLCYYLALPPGPLPQKDVQQKDVPQSHVPQEDVPRKGAGQVGGEELLIPDGHSEIVFTIANAFERWTVGQPEHREVMCQSYVIGGRSRSVITSDRGPVVVAGVKLDPRALRWLIRTPLSEFAESTLALRELQLAPLIELEDAVAQATSRPASAAEAVARTLDRFLLAALRAMPTTARPIDELITRIRATRGALPIMGWIEDNGLDARQVERQFATTMGMTPKRYARVIRFKHSYHQLIGGATRASGAHLDGFYDQSHFNKEFRAFIGAPPTARLAATLRHGTSISDHLLVGELSLGNAAATSP